MILDCRFMCNIFLWKNSTMPQIEGNTTGMLLYHNYSTPARTGRRLLLSGMNALKIDLDDGRLVNASSCMENASFGGPFIRLTRRWRMMFNTVLSDLLWSHHINLLTHMVLLRDKRKPFITWVAALLTHVSIIFCSESRKVFICISNFLSF